MPAGRSQRDVSWTALVRRALLAAGTAAVLLMVWAAVHDIVRGEADLTAEWSFLVFGGLLAACAAMGWLMRVLGRRPPAT